MLSAKEAQEKSRRTSYAHLEAEVQRNLGVISKNIDTACQLGQTEIIINKKTNPDLFLIKYDEFDQQWSARLTKVGTELVNKVKAQGYKVTFYPRDKNVAWSEPDPILIVDWTN